MLEAEVALRVLELEDGSEGHDGPPPKEKKRGGRNPARDRWLYDERVNGVSQRELLLRLSQEHTEWEQIYSPSGITAACKRLAEGEGLEWPITPNTSNTESALADVGEAPLDSLAL